jgi:uncharacterized RDD family membrane protein YckC
MPFCANCGRELSDQALACPNCGHPNEARTNIPEVQFTKAPPGPGTLAGFWRRLAALLIDVILVSIVAAPFGITVYIGAGRLPVKYNPASPVLDFVYSWLMIGLANGRTVGCMALGVRVASPDGAPLGLGRAAARQAMAIVSGSVILLGYLWALWDREKRTWHDMVADSRVFFIR